MPFRSIAVQEANDNTITITKPDGVVEGDILVAFAVSDDNAASTFTWPTDFVELTGTPLTSSADAQTVGCAIKVAGGSEPASYDISNSGNSIIGGIAAFSGCAITGVPHQSSVGSSSIANASPWSMATAAFGSNTSEICDLIFIAGSDVTTNVDVTHTGPSAPGAFTVRADIRAGARNGMLSTLDSQAAGQSGALTGTGTAASASAGWNAIAIALENTGGGEEPPAEPPPAAEEQPFHRRFWGIPGHAGYNIGGHN